MPDLNRGPDRSLGPDRRVKKRQDFLRIQSKGKKWRSKHFLLSACEPELEGDSESRLRLGVTITKRLDKRAARRNRLRRRVKEVFRLNRHRMTRSADVVVIGLDGATELPFKNVESQLKYLFYQAKLIPPHPKHKPRS